MNAAEIKLDLFRRIDSLNESDLNKVYHKFIAVINSTSKYKVAGAEKDAIETALQISKESKSYTREEVMQEAKQKYPDLKFK